MKTGIRRMAMVAALAGVAALAVGCASQPGPRVAVVRFTDTRDWVDPGIEGKHIFGRKEQIADWTTEELARRIKKAGYNVVILSTDAEAQGDEAVVSGTVYRWNIAAFKKFMEYDAVAAARGQVTVTRAGKVVLDKFYTGNDTAVHASEALLVYDASRGPLKEAACKMVDCMASGVIDALGATTESPAKAEVPKDAPKTP